MDRTGIHSGHEDIKGVAVPDEQLPDIDVTERVMARLREPGRSRSGISLTGRATAVSGMLVLVLLITATAYAASEYIQIRNKAGQVKVQHLAETEKSQLLQGKSSYHKYEQKLMDFAEPGEQIVYFVRGEPLSEGQGSLLQFADKDQRITEYPAFLDQMKAKSSPLILPETAGGYDFKYGVVRPLYPLLNERDNNPVYRQALSELIGEAKKDKTRNLFMKVMPWSETGDLSALYTKDGAVIEIWAFLMNGSDITVYQQPDSEAEKIKVGSRDVVYNYVHTPVKPSHYLTWYDEQSDAYIMVTTFGDRVLTKEQLLKLAGELMEGGL